MPAAGVTRQRLLGFPSGVTPPAARDPALTPMLAAMAKAGELGHSRRTFLEHLAGTWRILALWRQPRVICRAGLMHSGYATVFYPHALFPLEERERVVALAGRRAELLIHLFSVLDRRALRAAVEERGIPAEGLLIREFRPVPGYQLGPRVVAALMAIEVANIAEQSAEADGSPSLWMSRVSKWAAALRPHRPLPVFRGAAVLDAEAETGARALYLEGAEKQSPKLLREACALNPHVAEPHILLSQLEPRQAEARRWARQGKRLLLRWGAAWDKRRPWATWLSLAERKAR